MSRKQTERRKFYQAARAAGMNALNAWSTSKTLVAWAAAERRGLVRIRAEAERESYFDVYGRPDGYIGANGRRVSAEQETKELVDMLDAKGCWRVIGERSTCRRCGTWEQVDSVGMCTGFDNPTDWRENWCVPDIMAETLLAAGVRV
jgi:hypothetical protein